MRCILTFSRATALMFMVVVQSLAWLSPEPIRAQPSPSPTPGASSVAPASGSAHDELNIAFDQIDRTIRGAGTPPPFNTFAQDAAAVEDYQSTSMFPSQQDIQRSLELSMAASALSFLPFGSIAASAAMAAQQASMQRKMEHALKTMSGPNPGTLTRYFFYHGWTRIETHALVLIVRPDRHQRIYVIPANKTYRVEQIAPVPSAAPEPEDSVPPNPAKVDATVTITRADAATIAEATTAGFRSDASTTLSGGIDPCVDGTYKATQLEYFITGPEPLPGAIPDAQAFYALTLPQDCYIPLAPQPSGPAVPYHQMYVYRLVSVVRDAALAAQPTPKPGKQSETANIMESMFGGGGGVGANYMLFSERANIRQLTDADASLFDIPAGYTQKP